MTTRYIYPGTCGFMNTEVSPDGDMEPPRSQRRKGPAFLLIPSQDLSKYGPTPAFDRSGSCARPPGGDKYGRVYLPHHCFKGGRYFGALARRHDIAVPEGSEGRETEVSKRKDWTRKSANSLNVIRGEKEISATNELRRKEYLLSITVSRTGFFILFAREQGWLQKHYDTTGPAGSNEFS